MAPEGLCENWLPLRIATVCVVGACTTVRQSISAPKEAMRSAASVGGTLEQPAGENFRSVSRAFRRAAPALAAYVVIRILGLLALWAFAAASGRSAHNRLVAWDSQWYRGIAENGYGFVRLHQDGRLLSDYAFFPLYPMVERVVAEATGLRYVNAGLVSSCIAAVFAAWGIFAIADHLYGHRVGVIATVLWASLPVSIVQTMAYSESLFTALAAWSIYAGLIDRWLTAGLLACLAGTTRPVGAAVVAALVIPAVVRCVHVVRSQPGSMNRWALIRPLAAALVAPLGWFGYFAWVGVRTGSPGGYFRVADGWGNGFDGGVAFAAWVADFLAGPDFLLGVLICVGIALLVWVLWLCVQQQQPLPLLIFSGLLVFVAMTTSGYFGSKLRYLLPAFPLLLPLAVWLARQRPAVFLPVAAVMVATSTIYGGIWLLGPGPP